MTSQIEQHDITCPKCDSEDVVFSKKRQLYVCPDCMNEFTVIPTTQPRIFISYARSDGEEFARNLCRRLVEENRFSIWQDRAEMEGGKNWWQQIVEALKNEYIEYMVLVMTPAAMGSDTVRREWRLARQEGVYVVPYIASPDLDINTLPKWMSAPHFVNPAIPEQWTRFIRTLESPCNEQRVAFMVEDLPEDFVMRSREFDQLITNLLNKQQEEPVAITAALRGAGGYGKTVLAKAICHDERIQEEFFDGILWITLGKNPGDLTKDVEDLIYVLSGERPGFANIETAVTWFVKLLDERHILMVIDDVWNAAHLKPFLQGGPQCARLITTRNLDTLPSNAKNINVDAMQQNEATSLIGAGLPQGNKDALRKLASRLGEWPLLLKLVNGTLHHRVQYNKQELLDALVYVNKALDKRGLTFFDARDAADRNQAVEKTLGVSMELLNPDECARYGELAIFPEDTDVPLDTLEKLWNTTGGLDDFDTESLCDRLMRLSLLLNFDLTARHIRLHDVVREYLIQKQSNKMPLLHKQLLDAYNPSKNNISHWAELPVDEPYLWHHFAYHMVRAKRNEDLRKLLLDFNWIQAKLDATDINSLITDYDNLPDDRALNLVQSVIRLSAHILARDKTQLRSQLHARLFKVSNESCRKLLEQIRIVNTSYLWLRLMTPSFLHGAGSPVWRTIPGHLHSVTAVGVTPDRRKIISVAEDDNIYSVATLKVWDIESCDLLNTLSNHEGRVTSIAITHDSQFVVSASTLGTLMIWDLIGQRDPFILQGHSKAINDVIVTENGLVISASDDCTLKIWDLKTERWRQPLVGHNGPVTAVVDLKDGRILSASYDGTLRIWDLKKNQEICLFSGPGGNIDRSTNTLGNLIDNTRSTFDVHSLVLYPDGKRVLAGSDRGVRIINIETGSVIKEFSGDVRDVRDVALNYDGRWAVAALMDSTLRVWDAETGSEVCVLRDHSEPVAALAAIPKDTRIVSGSYDHNVKIWDIEIAIQQSNESGESDISRKIISPLAFTPDGCRVICSDINNKLGIWDPRTWRFKHFLQGRVGITRELVVSPDGKQAGSIAKDGKFHVWSLDDGKLLFTSTGITKENFSRIKFLYLSGDIYRGITESSDGEELKFIDLTTGNQLSQLITESGICAIVPMPDNESVVIATIDSIYIWELNGKNQPRAVCGQAANSHKNLIHDSETWLHHGDETLLALGGDGKYFVTTSYNPRAKYAEVEESIEPNPSDDYQNPLLVWNFINGGEPYKLFGHSMAIRTIAAIPGSNCVVSAGQGRIIRVWDVKDGKQLFFLKGHQNPIVDLAVFPGGRFIVSASWDKSIKIWDLEKKKLVTTFTAETPLSYCSVMPDGFTIITGDWNGSTHILRLEGFD